MMGNYIRWAIRFTHVPTGESVTLDSNHFRSQRKARDAAIKLIRSRLYARRLSASISEVAVYDLGNDQFTDDLTEYRCDV